MNELNCLTALVYGRSPTRQHSGDFLQSTTASFGVSVYQIHENHSHNGSQLCNGLLQEGKERTVAATVLMQLYQNYSAAVRQQAVPESLAVLLPEAADVSNTGCRCQQDSDSGYLSSEHLHSSNAIWRQPKPA